MKKTIIYLVAIFSFVFAQIAMCQPHLEVVWEKDLFPIEIGDAKFSVDGKWVYCVVNSTIRKMDAMTGEFVSTFDNSLMPKGYYVIELVISSKGNYLLTGNGNGAIDIWDTKSEQFIKEIQLGATSAVFTPDETKLLIASGRTETKGVVLVDLLSGEILKIGKSDFNLHRIQISHDGKTFVTGTTYETYTPNPGWRNKLVLWDAITLTQIKVIEDAGEGSAGTIGYQKIQYSMEDKFVSYLRISYGNWRGFLRDLQDSKLYYETEYNRECSVVEFLPDSINYLTSEYKFDGDIQCFGHELFKIPNIKIDSSGIPLIGICVTSQIKGINYVFNQNATTKLLCQSTTEVEETSNPNFKYNITSELIQISLLNTSENIKGIKIIDVNGKAIYQQTNIQVTNNSMIIPNTFRTGTYFLIVTTPEKEYSHKFQVVR